MPQVTKIYRQYTTGLKLQYASGALTKEQYKTIPRSTRQYWKKIAIDQFWQPASFSSCYDHDNLRLVQALAEIQVLKSRLRSLAYLLLLYRTILKCFTLKQQHYISVKALVGVCRNRLANAGPDHRSFYKWFPFSPHQCSAWDSRKICKLSLLSLCRAKHPHQLTTAEINCLKENVCQPEQQHWPLASRYFYLLRKGLLQCSLSTFYKYCRLLNITKPTKRKLPTYTPLRAAKPLEWLHMDVTIEKQVVAGTKIFLHVIRDNYSRAILGCKAAMNCCSKTAKTLLEEVLTANNLMDMAGKLITDDGSENKGEVDAWLQKPGMLWKRLVAQVDITQSNSMAEAINKTLKHQFLQHLQFNTVAELQAALPTVLKAYNNMPLACLYGLTPNEVLQGAVPDRHQYAEQIATAKKTRLAANQKFTCPLTC